MNDSTKRKHSEEDHTEGCSDRCETIEQWAARVAPTLEACDWRQAEAWITPGGFCPAIYDDGESQASSVEKARALLAYRDKVADGITPAQRDWILGSPRRASITATLNACIRKGIVDRSPRCSWELVFTDFGREIARVLGGDQ